MKDKILTRNCNKENGKSPLVYYSCFLKALSMVIDNMVGICKNEMAEPYGWPFENSVGFIKRADPLSIEYLKICLKIYCNPYL